LRTDKAAGRAAVKKNSRKKLIIALIIIAVILALLAGTAAFAYHFLIKKFGKMEYTDLSGKDFGIDPGVEKQLKGYRNILLIGLDTRTGESESYSRSDAIIIATINKETGKITLTSVYRDTMLDIDEDGEHKLDKVTRAYMYGGPLSLMRTLNRNMDLNIKEYIKVNWQTVADVTDAMGGLKLNVKDYEIDEMNKYIKSTNKTLHGNKTKIKKAGWQTLNGIQTVTYCRIRKVGNGDYERSERMRRTLKAAFKKAKTMKLSELNDIANATLPEIGTDISAESMTKMAIKAFDYKLGKNYGWPYDVTAAIVDGVWYGPPVTLESNVKELHGKLFKQKDYAPSDKVQQISNRIKEEIGEN